MAELGWLIRPSADVSWAWTWSEVNAEGALTAEWQVIEVADAADIERLRTAAQDVVDALARMGDRGVEESAPKLREALAEVKP